MDERQSLRTDAGARRVLIASSDTTVARIVELSLSHAPYTSRAEASHDAALRTLEEWRPDLLIVYAEDARWERLLGARPERRRLPVIVLTRRGDTETKLTAFERGADDFLRVPFDADELVARCAAVIRRAYGDSVPVIAPLRIGDLEVIS